VIAISIPIPVITLAWIAACVLIGLLAIAKGALFRFLVVGRSDSQSSCGACAMSSPQSQTKKAAAGNSQGRRSAETDRSSINRRLANKGDQSIGMSCGKQPDCGVAIARQDCRLSILGKLHSSSGNRQRNCNRCSQRVS
jgi:hypothetical protein